MWPLPIRELFFVGSAAQKKMEALGLHTIGQLAACDLELLKAHLGRSCAVLIHQYANGVDETLLRNGTLSIKPMATVLPCPGTSLIVTMHARCCCPL